MGIADLIRVAGLRAFEVIHFFLCEIAYRGWNEEERMVKRVLSRRGVRQQILHLYGIDSFQTRETLEWMYANFFHEAKC